MTVSIINAQPDAEWANIFDLPCQQVDPELFFSDIPAEIERAKGMCRSCPLAASCLAQAVARHEFAGVWGGQLFAAGKIVARKRPRGRPRKHPLPEPVAEPVELRPIRAA